MAKNYKLEVVLPEDLSEEQQAFYLADVLWRFSERLNMFGILYDRILLKDSDDKIAGIGTHASKEGIHAGT